MKKKSEKCEHVNNKEKKNLKTTKGTGVNILCINAFLFACIFFFFCVEKL